MSALSRATPGHRVRALAVLGHPRDPPGPSPEALSGGRKVPRGGLSARGNPRRGKRVNLYIYIFHTALRPPSEFSSFVHRPHQCAGTSHHNSQHSTPRTDEHASTHHTYLTWRTTAYHLAAAYTYTNYPTNYPPWSHGFWGCAGTHIMRYQQVRSICPRLHS